MAGGDEGRTPAGRGRAGLALGAVGVGLALIGAGVAARPDDAPRVEVAAGTNRPVATPEGAGPGADPFTAWSSPVLVANPARPEELVVAARVERPQFGAGLARSTDGGQRWSPVALPRPPGEAALYAPSAAFDEQGRLHVAFATLSQPANNPTGLWLASSADGGASFSAPVAVAGAYAYQPRVAAGNGRVHVSFVQATDAVEAVSNGFGPPPNPVRVATSVDGGASFAAPVTASASGRSRVGAAAPVVAAGGSVLVLYTDYGDDAVDLQGLAGGTHQGRFALVLARSRDGGATFEEAAVVDDALVPAGRFNPYTPPFPSLAADPEVDTVYAAWADARGGDLDVYVRRSDDAGGTWGAPVRVNPTTGADQHLPVLSVAVGGRVDVAYLDRSLGTGPMTAAALATSFDFGASWNAVALSDTTFDATVGPEAVGGGTDPGSFLGLASTRTAALAVWPDARAGTPDTGRRDLYFAPVRIAPET